MGSAANTLIQSKMRQFLSKIAKPTCVFAANDTTAREVISSAKALELSIPDDIAVVSIDNNELIATSITPSLSSVEINFNEAGLMAAELLDQQMKNPEAKLKNIFFSPLRVMRRASTMLLQRKDSCVEAAQERIIRDATNGLTAADVAQMFPCSRRMAEIRFRKATGTSIGDAILDARFTLVLSLLKRNDIHLDTIADFTGWKSPAVLRQYFKRKTGLSMRTYRKNTATATLSTEKQVNFAGNFAGTAPFKAFLKLRPF